MSRTSNAEQIAAVLAGTLRYDEAGDDVQAAVRDAWDAEQDHLIGGLDLEAQFRSEGRTSWVSTADGRPITVYADGRRTPPSR